MGLLLLLGTLLLFELGLFWDFGFFDDFDHGFGLFVDWEMFFSLLLTPLSSLLLRLLRRLPRIILLPLIQQRLRLLILPRHPLLPLSYHYLYFVRYPGIYNTSVLHFECLFEHFFKIVLFSILYYHRDFLFLFLLLLIITLLWLYNPCTLLFLLLLRLLPLLLHLLYHPRLLLHRALRLHYLSGRVIRGDFWRSSQIMRQKS